MAGELQYDAASGALLYHSAADACASHAEGVVGALMAECCCAADACTTCGVAQVAATVEIAPSNGCDELTGEYSWTYDGNCGYVWPEFGEFCTWMWGMESPLGGDCYLVVVYRRDTDTWDAGVGVASGVPGSAWLAGYDLDVTCNVDGSLSGVVELESEGDNCPDQTATVSLG